MKCACSDRVSLERPFVSLLGEIKALDNHQTVRHACTISPIQDGRVLVLYALHKFQRWGGLSGVWYSSSIRLSNVYSPSVIYAFQRCCGDFPVCAILLPLDYSLLAILPRVCTFVIPVFYSIVVCGCLLCHKWHSFLYRHKWNGISYVIIVYSVP